MKSFLIIALLVSRSGAFPSAPVPEAQNSSAVNFLAKILEDFNQRSDPVLESTETIISSAMPISDQLEHLKFNISTVKGALKSAELRVFQRAAPECDPAKLEVLQNGCFHCDPVKFATQDPAGWLVFDVTEAVEAWRKEPGRNYGFQVSGECSSNVHLGKNGSFSPLLVSYAERKRNPMDIEALVRTQKRSVRNQMDAESETARKSRNWNRTAENHRTVKKNLPDYGINSTHSCELKEVEIKFEDILWDHIIAPKVVRLRYCLGLCNYTQYDGIYAPGYDHFMMIEALKQIHPEEFRGNVCLPTEFSGQRFLIFDEKNNIVIKNIANVIAKKCPS